MGKRLGGIKSKIKYNKKTSRQAQDQKRYKAMGLCVKCQKPIWEGINKQFCEKHTLMVREYQRKREGTTKRNNNCKSYIIKKEK